MNYDFTSILDRKGKDALAIDALGTEGFPDAPQEGFDAIPMWVADMNFPVCPTIVEAIIKRANHPSFGYFSPRKEYTEAIIRWQTTRHHFTDLTTECIGYENGVLGGVVTALNVLCSKGDAVLVHSPTYIGFTHALTNNGYQLVHTPLVKDEHGIWRMDYEDMEQKIKTHKIHATVFCSPHNPCGRVWERWELEKAMALFERYDVKVVSDEIWSDILLNGHQHLPTQMVNEWAKQNTISMYAPSKTFSLAGLVGSYHIIFNPTLKDRVEKESSLSHYNSMNVLSEYALIGAYQKEGYKWCDELCEVLSTNVNWAVEYIQTHFEGVKVSKPEGTYMLFVDCTEWCKNHNTTIEELEKELWKYGIAVQDGRAFHGECHIRMNLASPFTRIKEAFERMNDYVFNKNI